MIGVTSCSSARQHLGDCHQEHAWAKDFRVEPRVFRRALLDNGYLELPITSEHAVNIDMRPPIHRDPFDRLLIAQALVDGVTLLTTDDQLSRYGSPVQRV